MTDATWKQERSNIIRWLRSPAAHLTVTAGGCSPLAARGACDALAEALDAHDRENPERSTPMPGAEEGPALWTDDHHEAQGWLRDNVSRAFAMSAGNVASLVTLLSRVRAEGVRDAIAWRDDDGGRTLQVGDKGYAEGVEEILGPGASPEEMDRRRAAARAFMGQVSGPSSGETHDRERAQRWLSEADIGARGAFMTRDVASLASLLHDVRRETIAACVTLVEGMKGEEHWVIVDHVRHLVPSSPFTSHAPEKKT